jgi:diguanylate cyclase (GGDEF)-like protein/PAS domain S-box-containing protein
MGDTKQTLLIVDDEPVNIKLLQTIFKKDYRITAANNGESALKIANSEVVPDLILLDVMMPTMDGYTVLKKLKENVRTQNIAVLFVTAKLDSESESKGLELGALDYVAKPINTKVVKAKVRNHMKLIRQHNFIESLLESQQTEMLQKDKSNEGQLLANEELIKNYLTTIKNDREQLQLALWGSGNELWDLNVSEGKINRCFDNSQYLLPVEFDKHCGLMETLANNYEQFIHPVDFLSWKETLGGIVEASCDTFSLEYRIKSNNGNWIWIQDKGRVIERDNQGQIIRMAGTIQSIEQRKITERTSRTITHAFQNTSDGVWVADANFCVQIINNAFCSITQLQKDEVINKVIAFPNIKGQGDDFVEMLQRELSRATSWCGEVWLTRGDEIYPIELRVNKIQNAEDCSTQFVGVFTDITYRKKAEEELIKLANYDELTNLANRTLLYERINKSIISIRGVKNKFGLLFIDLDNFKRVNDTLGHNQGDQLLVQVAERLTLLSREEDTVARLGGDEFIILIEPVINNHIIAKLAQRVVDAISKPFLLSGHEVIVTPSVGISSYPDDSITKEELIKHADIAMYEAKIAGKGMFKFFKESMTNDALERLTMESDLRQAIANEDIFLHYQPKVDVLTEEYKGLEVLARWELNGKMVPPNIFINIAEENNLIIALGRLILKQACHQYQQWLIQGIAIGRIAVNFSAKQFMDPNLLENVQLILKETGLSAHYLEIEITETAVIEDTEKAIAQMHSIRELGIHLAMDDFGTGYSSLNYLKQFPLNTLKIDQCFVQEMLLDKRSKSIVEMIIKMAHTLELKVVAEGVESIEQAQIIKELHGEQIQGYFYSKPLSAKDYEEVLLKQKSDSKTTITLE